MRKNLIFTLSVCSVLALSSCSKMGALSADNFTVTPNPLETKGGQVPATINGAFPEKYMKKNAVVTVIPELRYGNGQVAKGTGSTFQGEKVLGNDQMISYRLGGRYTMKTAFDFVPAMQKSDMYLTFSARRGNKKINIPAVKVAEGVVATSELYKQLLLSDGGCIAPDSFQRVNARKQEANIKFLVNQANLRRSELKNNSVKEFVAMLKRINADREKLNIRNVEVQAYASPEGGFSFNDKLAGKRQNTSEAYVKSQLKQTGVATGIDAHYTAQDWDGFQKLVQASNIQDKDVILRVLSMYKDPEQREQQIRNMSEAFRELADGILPELRRSRLIINYETIGRSDEQIKAQYATDATKLSVEEMLYYATLEDNVAKKEEIYKRTAEYYDKDYRALNNLATLAFKKGDEMEATRYLERALRVNPQAPEALANLGIMELVNGNVKEAETSIAKALGEQNVNVAIGSLNLAKGNFAQAEKDFEGVNSNSAALAQLMNKNYAAAAATLDKVANPNALTDYLHAIVAARRGNKFAAESYLKEALKKDPSLKTYADNDLELSILR
ncbi:tetratricopeptide repeat protein [Hoylesella buccalis]|uniref:tetratricopeptide repeat protein n=1 Tax=Hoylesella buccalis TaxID=28127 RepID=UPI001D14B0E7|nr:tetratricopeptide repeat protein [Hoylesella buccalis]UEA63715.1 tetratricopeptide repeat protein [Hoylesella buccalis]UWP48992.1 tetratricopeptide repeat protein [Hoylesella buccalis ATCC 35310]